MLQMPEYHQILAEAARDAAEKLEAGAKNPRLSVWDRARYAELARAQRRLQAYQEHAAERAATGRDVAV